MSNNCKYNDIRMENIYNEVLNECVIENETINGNKYTKYNTQYDKNMMYWGLGIENEVYLEFNSNYYVFNEELLTNRKKERYSVDYYTNYKSNYLEEAIKNIISNNKSNIIELPILLNSNSFIKTDKNNNSKTLYTKKCEPNPEYIGESLIESLQKGDSYFKENMNVKWLFDGDTIEFNTLKFFNTNLQDTIKELNVYKKEFVQKINESFQKHNILKKYGSLEIMKENYPFAIYLTNFKNIGMFNNGTLHFNITLPTKLDNNCQISDFNKFIKDHSKAIKIIQWLEPFIIAMYGSPDPFSLLKNYNDKQKFSAASQRCAISRYIGIGTYNSETMEKGKILTRPLEDILCNEYEYWWFTEFYKINAYKKLNEIGSDINFNKHENHGIELRFLDHIPDNDKLFECFEFIIYLMDVILESDNIESFGNPIIHPLWNKFVLKIIMYGESYKLEKEEIELYENIFKIKINKIILSEVYNEIYLKLMLKYSYVYKTQDKNIYSIKPNGIFSKKTIQSQYKCIDMSIIQPHALITEDIHKKSKWCFFF